MRKVSRRDLGLIADVAKAFFRQARVRKALAVIHEQQITGWEKWWQVEFALFWWIHRRRRVVPGAPAPARPAELGPSGPRPRLISCCGRSGVVRTGSSFWNSSRVRRPTMRAPACEGSQEAAPPPALSGRRTFISGSRNRSADEATTAPEVAWDMLLGKSCLSEDFDDLPIRASHSIPLDRRLLGSCRELDGIAV